MSAKLCLKLFCLTLLLILGLVQGPQAAHAATVAVTNPGTFATSDRPTLSVALTGITGSDTLALSLTVPNGAMLTSTGNGTLDSNTSTLTANGTYDFMLAHITKPGMYILKATLTGADTGMGVSLPFTVTAGVPHTISIASGPTPAAPAVETAFALGVTVTDADGNAVPDGTGVTLNLTNSDGTPVAGGVTLSGGSANTAGGTANFSASINKTGSYKVTATSGGITSAPSGIITVTPGPATQLAFGQQPTNAGAGVSLSPAVTVLIEDAHNNIETSAANAVTIAIGANPGGSTLGGAATVNAVGGVATFSNLALNKPSTGYTLTAAAVGLTGATSTGFDIVSGPATHLTVTAPAATPSGIPVSVTVTAKDQFENVATGYSGSLQFTSTDGAALLPGNSGLTNGTGTFSVLLKTAGTQTVTATDTVTAGITGTTDPITVSAGAAATLTFVQSPGNATVGATLSSTRVQVLDSAGNPKPGVVVTLSLAGPAATLGGTNPQTTNGSGIATFSDLTINATGTFQLVGSAPGGGGATISGSSTIFVVTAGAPAKLIFGQQPTGTVAGAALTPAVTVQVEDAAGNVVTTSAASVTLSITPGANPGSSTLGGTLTEAAVNGVATFSTLTLNKTGTGYKLDAASPALSGTTSAAFAIAPGPVGAGGIVLALPSPATGLTTDSTFSLTATVRDSQGNLVTNGTLVSLAISTGGGPGIVLTGGTANTLAGVATFSVSINKVGVYKFTATSSGISSPETGPLTISAGAVASLSFVRQPGSTGAGVTIQPAVTVLARDASGNVVPGAALTMTLGGTSSDGSPANVNGTTTQTTDSTGTAAFGDLSVSKIGSAYTLTASSGTVDATSIAFAVTAGPAASIVLGLSNPPAPITTDTFFTVIATVKDAKGFPVVDGTVVSLGLTNSDGTPVAAGTTLRGGTSSTAGGVAVFSVSISKAGAYLFTAASGTATAAVPLPVTISAGAVATLTFTQQPTSTSAGAAIAPPITVQAKDAGGNVVPNAGISLALSGTPTTGGTAVLGGTETQTTDPTGTATFSNLSISKVGTAYTLTASAGSAPSVASSSFAITPGLITLAFTAQPPASTVSGAPFAASVSLLDGSGNPVPNAPVTLTLSQGAGILTGNATQNTDAAGRATFSGLSIDKASADKQLTATATVTTGTTTQTYTAMTAPAFAITPGAAATLSFMVQPPAVVTDPATSFTVTVQALDAGQNPVADSPTTTVTLSLSGSGAAALGGGITQSTVGGTATFTGLKVSAPGTYQVTAAAQTTSANTSATPAVSTSFTVGNSPGSITRLTTDVGIVHAGDPAFTLTITGTNFVPGAVVSFSGAASVLADPKATPLVTNVTVSSDGTQVTATIAASLVARAGNPLVTVLNPGTDPNNPGKSNFLVYPLGPVADAAGTPHTDLTAQYLNPGIQLFSVPFDYKADAAGTPLLVGDVLRAFDVSPTTLTITDTNASPTLAVWDPVLNGYLLTTGAAVPVFQPDGVTADSLVLGQGYWGRFQFHPAADPTRQAGLAVRGLDASALPDSRKLSGQTFAITLQPGWNMIGDPFTGAINLSLIQVQPLDGTGKPAGSAISLVQASDSGFVNDFFYKYVGGTGYVPVTPAGVLLPGGAPASSDNKLSPYVGYWAFSYHACQLLVPAP